MQPDKSKFDSATVCKKKKKKQQSVIYRHNINPTLWFSLKTKLWQPRVPVVLLKE